MPAKKAKKSKPKEEKKPKKRGANNDWLKHCKAYREKNPNDTKWMVNAKKTYKKKAK